MLAIGFWTGYFAGILTIPILLLVMFVFYILVIIVEHKKNMLKMVEHNAEYEKACREHGKDSHANT